MSTSAEALVAGAASESTEAPEAEVDIVNETDIDSNIEEVDTEPEETEEESEEEETELPDAVKDILKKNRKAVREAEARASAAEKALAKAQNGETESDTTASDRFKDLYISSAAKSALLDAGITTGTDRFLKMLDLSKVEVDDDGKVSGLEDQIEDIKEDFKDVLAPKKVRVKADPSGRRTTPAIPKSSAELLAARLG